MKLLSIIRFELSYQLSRPWPWVIVTVLFALVFLFIRDGSFSEALFTEYFINSPFHISFATVFGTLLWLLSSPFIAGEAASRDIATGMHPLMYTTPITRGQYLGGRFLAALLINAFILLTVQVSILLAIYLPGVQPESLGPFRPAAFINAYLFIAIPTAFATTSLQFAFALLSGRPINAYIASLGLFFTSFFIASFILFKKGIGVLIDPIGVRFIWEELSHLWTTVEKSHRLLEFNGTLLYNRIIWIGVGLLAFAITYLRFQFAHRTVSSSWLIRVITGNKILIQQKDHEYQSLSGEQLEILRANSIKRKFGFTYQLRQLVHITWLSFKKIAISWVGFALLIFIPLLTIAIIIDQMEALGLPLIPTTARVVKELTGPLSSEMSRWIIIPGFIAYFAGELTWRERDSNMGEISDALPVSEWASVLGKLFGLFLVLIAFTIALTGSGIAAQSIMEYNNYEIGLYLEIMFGLQLPEYMLFAVLALFIHVFVDQKYLGHLVAIVAYAFIAALASMFNIEHNLLIYGGSPSWSYTYMRGFGVSIGPWLWFKLYWAAWALLLLVATTLFLVRGRESGFKFRLRIAKQRFTKQTPWVTGVAVLLVVSIGGFIFYNTNILNKYVNSNDASGRSAAYEKRYGQYENTPQPQVTGTKLNIEIYPTNRSLDIQGSYQLVNNTNVVIDSIHISTSMSGALTRSMTFNRDATLAVDDELHHYRIYRLGSALKPGDSIQLSFDVSVQLKGFRNQGVDPSLVESGSAFNNESWFPFVGFQRKRGIINPAERRKHGLDARPVIASLYEAHEGEPISFSNGVNFDAVIGTNDGQFAVAPGDLKRTWKENGRSYYHYTTSDPIGSEWNFFSAEYGVFEKQWTPSDGSHKPVTVRIFHHPQHTAHLDYMMGGAVSSLEFYSKEFSPYPYDHLTVVEHPGAPGTGMHAEASMIYYGQGYPYWIPKNENGFDLPYGIMGHEMGHQWTLPYALVEGLPFMSEGLAWYYSIMLVKNTRGVEDTRRLMQFMRQPYPYQPIRRGEPLLRAVDPYLAYKRGPMAMYALSEYMGADSVDKALRTLIQKSELPGASPVSTLNLYRELKAVAPDSLQAMLHDLFEVNTLWMFEVNKVNLAKLDTNKWQVTLDVTAQKIVYDSAGVETEVPMDYEWVDIGVFGRREPGKGELSANLYLNKHRIRSGDQTIKIIVPREPVAAGIDPHHLLDWQEKEDDDNIEGVNPED